MRAATRVFCDFDMFKQSVGQMNAGYPYNGVNLVLSGGRTVPAHSATYVDADGSAFPTAELSPNTAVRMMIEYDDVPENQTSASLAYGQNRIQNVGITEMNIQENGNLAPRSAGGGNATTQQGSTQSTTGANAGSAVQNTTDKINGASQKVSDTKAKWGGVLGNVKNAATTKPQ